MMRTILVVPDTRRCVGFGHVSRATTLAEALAKRGCRVSVLVPHGAPPVPHSGARWTIRRGSDPVKTAVRLRAETVVLDGYGLPARLAAPLARRGIQVVCIDDTGLPRLPLSLVVNPNAHARPGLYRRVPCRLGPRFALLREAVVAARDHAIANAAAATAADEADHVFVCMGGADPDGRTLQVLDALATMPPGGALRCTVVLGPSADAGLVAEVGARVGRLLFAARMLHAPPDFVAVLASAGLAVVSGGVVLTESLFLGVPAVALVLAENQREGVAAWRRAGAVVVGAADTAGLAAQIRACLDDAAGRRRMARQGLRLLDGHGAERVARVIVSNRFRGR